MSKLAIGCAGLLVVGVAGAAGASYFAYHKVASAVAPVAALGSLGEIERSVRSQGPVYAAGLRRAEPGTGRALAGGPAGGAGPAGYPWRRVLPPLPPATSSR